MSLAFLDLDRFKLVNDAHGHLVGSELLARTGQRLQELSREQDLCFRYGGDEFVVLMPETGARSRCAWLRTTAPRARSTTSFQMKNGLQLSVSASVGLATAPADGDTVHAIIGAADARMYAVKTARAGSRARESDNERQLRLPAHESVSNSLRSSVTIRVDALLAPASLLQLIRQSSDSMKAPRFAPARLDDHMQLEIHPRPQQRLDLAPRAGADLLQLRSALADQDRLLPIALAVDRRGNARQRRARRRALLAAVPSQAPALRTARSPRPRHTEPLRRSRSECFRESARPP